MDLLSLRRAMMRSAWAIFLLLYALRGLAQEIQLSEDQAKAVYLVNLTKYIEWPSHAFADQKSPIVICVLGEESLRDELKKLAPAARSSARPVQVQAWAGTIPKACHIVFISDSEKRRIPEVLAEARNHSTVTVSETDTFIQAGGVINLVRRDKRLRLQINLSAAERAGIKISSRLLQVSDVINTSRKS